LELAKSQQAILERLKNRGPQSVKILASQLGMTTMGVRQHLGELQARDLVRKTDETRQTRGRPVHYWKLSARGHQQFPDRHGQLNVQLIATLRDELGRSRLNKLVDVCASRQQKHYEQVLEEAGNSLEDKVRALSRLRSEEGFMAEVRLLPEGWLLIENHCPLFAAAESCGQFCQSELDMFRSLLANYADVQRVDHLFSGARRCAYKIIDNSH
jgi:predicted ArsR family transcriptional regulator